MVNLIIIHIMIMDKITNVNIIQIIKTINQSIKIKKIDIRDKVTITIRITIEILLKLEKRTKKNK